MTRSTLNRRERTAILLGFGLRRRSASHAADRQLAMLVVLTARARRIGQSRAATDVSHSLVMG